MKRVHFRDKQGVLTHDLPYTGQVDIPPGADTFEVVEVVTRADVIDAFVAGLTGRPVADDTNALGDAYVAGREIAEKFVLNY